MQLTENFTLQEFLDSDTAVKKGIKGQFNPPANIVSNLALLAGKLQDIRNRYNKKRVGQGKPRIAMKINSGWRSPELNKAVGGSNTSAHMSGLAADVVLTIRGQRADKATFADFYNYVQTEHTFDQLINEHKYSWIHIGYKLNESEYRNMVFNIG